MISLETENGRWALKDNSMVFGKNVVISHKNEAYKYHLVDSDKKEIPLEKPITEYVIEHAEICEETE